MRTPAMGKCRLSLGKVMLRRESAVATAYRTGVGMCKDAASVTAL
ncbi:MAG: hypothetical protein ABI114_09720 [Rhodanobacter sp.]